jgi:hypothetical protein
VVHATVLDFTKELKEVLHFFTQKSVDVREGSWLEEPCRGSR